MSKNFPVKKISTSELNKDSNGVFDLVKLRPIGLTKNGRITAYLISASTYEALIKNLSINYQIEDLLNIRST